MFNKIDQKQKGFILLETFMVIIFSLIVAAVAAASVISYKKAADLKNQISDAKELLQNISSATKTSTTWLQPNKTDLNVFNTLGDMQALPYSLQTQYVAGKTDYISRLGGIINIGVNSVGPPGNTQLYLKFTGISSADCDELADSLMLPGIVSLSIGGINQALGPTLNNLSSRDPSSPTYATACTPENQTLIFTYQKQSMIINNGISDVDFSDPSWVVGSGGKKVAGTGITQTGTSGVIVSGPGTSFDRGLYEARIYANNVQASVNVDIAYVKTGGGASVPILHTTDQNNPVGGGPSGTTQYIQGLGFNPQPSNTPQDPQTLVVSFDLPEDAQSVTMTVTSNDGKPITITKLTIYPVNPD